MQAQILAPAAVLVLWSLIMLFWMAGVRFTAVAKRRKEMAGSGEKPPKSLGRDGVRGNDLEGYLPDKANWPAHNFTNLMEQPTIFYPAVVILAIMGPTAVDVVLAWAYVVLRIIHSVYQSTVNKLAIRFPLFLLASLILVALAIRVVMATLFHDPGALPQ